MILRVWHVDPLRRPVCQNPRRVIALIDAPRVVENTPRQPLALGTTRLPACPRQAPQCPTPANHVGMWTRCPITKTC
jgi:hypothetical protein